MEEEMVQIEIRLRTTEARDRPVYRETQLSEEQCVDANEFMKCWMIYGIDLH